MTKSMSANTPVMVDRAVFEDLGYKASKMRIWGGMDWHWHSIYAKQIFDTVQEILDKHDDDCNK